MQILLTGAGVLAGLVFLAVVVARYRPLLPDALRVAPADRRPGWRVDPAGVPGHVRFWDGSSWATESVPGELAAAAGWRPPRVRYTPSMVLRAMALTFLVPLIVVTPIVTVLAFALSRLTLHVNLGGSNK